MKNTKSFNHLICKKKKKVIWLTARWHVCANLTKIVRILWYRHKNKEEHTSLSTGRTLFVFRTWLTGFLSVQMSSYYLCSQTLNKNIFYNIVEQFSWITLFQNAAMKETFVAHERYSCVSLISYVSVLRSTLWVAMTGRAAWAVWSATTPSPTAGQKWLQWKRQSVLQLWPAAAASSMLLEEARMMKLVQTRWETDACSPSHTVNTCCIGGVF